MTSRRILTLLSDFGHSDIYVGVMKGVIAGINPHLNVIDLTHQIPPQDIGSGRFNMMSAYPYFPADTVHVAVVDPGVGTQRRAIAIATPHGFFVAPDNGLLSGIWQQTAILAAVALTHTGYWYTTSPSSTFHGRDIFAAVGAHLASGVALDQLGSPLEATDLVDWDIPSYQVTQTGISGVIQYIDHFGNLVTTIPGSVLGDRCWQVHLLGTRVPIPGMTNYSQAPPGTALALVGSHGWVEVAINQGNACQYWGAGMGQPIQLELLSVFE